MLTKLARVVLLAAAASCGTPATAPPPTKTIDAGTAMDALPPVPPSPLPDARRLPDHDPR